MTSDITKDNARDVWAVVLMYGQESATSACLESLQRQDYPRLTVLLVDNASPDGAGERLRAAFPGIRYLNTQANLGYAAGNNRGIATAGAGGADLLVIANNDTIFQPDCVSRLVDSWERALRPGAIAPKILYYDDPSRIAFGGGDYSWLRAVGRHRNAMHRDDPGEDPRLDEITFVTGAAFLTSTRVISAMNGFREDFFMYCEDAELSLRLRRAGYRLYYQPAARVVHREPLGAAQPSPFGIFHRDRNRRRIVRAHYTRWQRLAFACWFYPSRALRLAQCSVRGDWARAAALVKGAIAP